MRRSRMIPNASQAVQLRCCCPRCGGYYSSSPSRNFRFRSSSSCRSFSSEACFSCLNFSLCFCFSDLDRWRYFRCSGSRMALTLSSDESFLNVSRQASRSFRNCTFSAGVMGSSGSGVVRPAASSSSSRSNWFSVAWRSNSFMRCSLHSDGRWEGGISSCCAATKAVRRNVVPRGRRTMAMGKRRRRLLRKDLVVVLLLLVDIVQFDSLLD